MIGSDDDIEEKTLLMKINRIVIGNIEPEEKIKQNFAQPLSPI